MSEQHCAVLQILSPAPDINLDGNLYRSYATYNMPTFLFVSPRTLSTVTYFMGAVATHPLRQAFSVVAASAAFR